MKFCITSFIVIFFIVHSISSITIIAGYDQVSPRESLANSIDASVRKFKIPRSYSSILIRDLTTGNTLYSLHPDLPLKPASNMKIITTAAALKLLNPEYQYATKVYSDEPIKNGILKHNIYLKGSGDPFLVPEFLWNLARLTAIKGIKEIHGHLVVDDTYFDQKKYPDSDWKRIKMPLWYNAPTGALSFNFNAISVWATPGNLKGSPISVKIDPSCGYFKLVNTATTSSSGKRNHLILDLKENNGFCEIYLKGNMPKNYQPQQYFRHVKDSSLYCGHAFIHYLKQNKVGIGSKIIRGSVPDDAKEILEHQSRPLSVLLRSATKFSNNFMMEQMLKTIGAVCKGSPGSTAKGALAVTEFLENCGINTKDFRMNDGSGLSRNNRITTHQLTDLIRYVIRNSTYGPEFLNALPVAGVDGTMKKRLDKNGYKRLVRAKTGVIDGVCALSGIIDGRKDNGIVFSIIVNNNRNRHRDVKKFQDCVLEHCIEYMHQVHEN